MYIEVGLGSSPASSARAIITTYIGTPKYWHWVGGFFSSLEPVPLLLMVWTPSGPRASAKR